MMTLNKIQKKKGWEYKKAWGSENRPTNTLQDNSVSAVPWWWQFQIK
jgi:hypothetical protein